MRMKIGIGAAFALMLILRLSSIVPQAPANLGLFQILTKEFLVHAYDVDPSDAGRFSLILWGVVKVMPLVAGFIALLLIGLALGSWRAHHSPSQTNAPPAGSGDNR